MKIKIFEKSFGVKTFFILLCVASCASYNDVEEYKDTDLDHYRNLSEALTAPKL